MTGATSAVRTPSHPSARKGLAEEYDKDNEDDDYAPGFHVHHHQQDPWHADEISMCQLGGVPLGIQRDEQVLTKLYFRNT